MEKVRILFLITDIGKGGAERFLIDLATFLKSRDDIAFKIGTLYKNNEYKHLTINLPIINLDFSPFSLHRNNQCPAFKKLLLDFKPNIIHTHRFLAEFLSSYYLDSNIRYVCHGHDNMIQLKKPTIKSIFSRRKLLDMLERRYLIKNKYKKVTTHFIANSNHTYIYYKNTLPKKSKHKVHLIQYGFNFNRFYRPEPNIININEPIKIINIGSFQKKKNQRFIVDIAKQLNKLNLNFELHLLGDGEERSNVEQLVKQNNLEDFFFFHGNVAKVENFLHQSHIYLHSAWYEPFGLVFLEAMAAGLPVVTLDGKGNRDIIENGKNGFLIYKEDAKEFANTIIKIINNKKLYRQLSDFSKEFASNFNINKKTEELINFYKQII